MKKDDIIRMAREAKVLIREHYDETGSTPQELERFAAFVAAHKTEVITAEAYRCGYKDGMEAAAVICDNLNDADYEINGYGCAGAIRARSKQ